MQYLPFSFYYKEPSYKDEDYRDLVEMIEATSAAKEVYLQYADRKDLIVALIGDYQGYNAVMLQAQDNEGWLRLCEEFGVQKHVDADALDTTRVSSLTVVSSRTIDNINDIDEDIEQMLKEITGNDSIGLHHVHIDTTFAIRCRKHYDHGILVDSSTSIVTTSPSFPNSLIQTTYNYGNTGYIVRDDSDALTLWLFFYSTPAEKEQILNHVTSINTQK